VNILDTDALSHHMKRDPIGTAIEARTSASANPDFWMTAVSALEMAAGAVALHKSLKKRRKDLLPGFDLIQEVVEYLAGWRGKIHRYDASAERISRGFAPRLRQELGEDARIAATALSHGAAVWTCNVDDFKRVPGLAVYGAETGLRVA
jgi:predicted nucleic acid-binding protein